MALCKLSRRYAPQVNPNVTIEGITPPDTNEPTLSLVNYIILTHPFVSPTTTLQIRNPKIGNTIRLVMNRISRESRGRTIHCYRDPDWPQYDEHSYEFEALTEEDKDAILEFYDVSLGTEIGLLDYESRQWRGYIIEPNRELSQTGLGCQYNAQILFQGELA